MPLDTEDDLPEPTAPRAASADGARMKRNPLIPRMKLKDYQPDPAVLNRIFESDIERLRREFPRGS